MFPYLDLGPTIAQHESDIYADVNVIHEEEVIATELPCLLPALSEEAASVQEFLEALPRYSESMVKDFEEATRGQMMSGFLIEGAGLQVQLPMLF